MSSNPRPAKRLRTSVNLLSDHEDEESSLAPPPPDRSSSRSSTLKEKSQSSSSFSSTTVPSKKRTRAAVSKPIAQASSAKSSPKSSPEKKPTSKKAIAEGSKNKSLHTFFNKVNDEARWRQRSATPDTTKRDEPIDDIVDDDSLDGTMIGKSHVAERENRKDSMSFASRLGSSTAQKNPPSSSQRFITPSTTRSSEPQSSQHSFAKEYDIKPWSNLYAPRSIDELGVHKKKIQDVQAWLIGALASKIRQRILVLKGPAGSGKSTTVELLCQTHKCDVVSWRNPDTLESGALSSSLQFAEFVTRGGDYGALSLNAASNSSLTASSSNTVLLIEDFPASLMSNHMALDSFRSVLLQAATSPDTSTLFGRKSSSLAQPPIILVISETLVSSFTGYTDSFTAQRLLGPELTSHPGISIIEFNPVAPTILSKALDLVIKKEARDSARRKIPGSALLQRLAEMGDLRNAINSLQLLCTKGDDSNDWTGTVAARINSKRGSKSNPSLSEAEANSVKLINSRETTLDMFHAVAKVCYNKREDPRANGSVRPLPAKPPDHLMHLHKPEISQVDVEDLLNETGTDIQTFISTLHHNYVLSCNNYNFVDHLDACASFLSDSELLDPDRRAHLRSKARATSRQINFQLGTSDALRQGELSFDVATRGVLFSLPHPVSRATLPGSRKMDAFKMFYPASLRIWKPLEETNAFIDLVISQLSGTQAGRSRVEDEGVSSWQVRQSRFASWPQAASIDNSDEESLPRIDLNKDSLILDTLPYLARIRSSYSEDVSTLKRITQMGGFDVSIDGDSEDESASAPSVPFTRRVEAVHDTLQIRQKSQRQNGIQGPARSNSAAEAELPTIEKLWLEDDDIEDD